MSEYIAVCPSSAGMFQAQEIEVTAETVADAHSRIWARLIGSRYVSRIYKRAFGEWIEVWREGQPL